MSLLREIQDAAINSEVELATLLRKCKVLAARLGNDEFKSWVDNELDGYKSADGLPDYRILTVNSKGHFAGAFGSGLNNADIPLSCIPEEFRENLEKSYMRGAVASLETLVSKSTSGTASEPWNPDLVAFVGQDIYQGMNCLQAWKVIPLTSIVAALDAVRNRILSFVLEIESEAPDAGEAALHTNPLPQEKVHQIFNTYITGNVQNVATGSSDFEQHAITNQNQPEVFSQLLEAIESVKHDASYTEVQSSIREMESNYGTDSFKDKYQSFMSVLSNHITVLGPIVAPCLPALAALIA
ncbi:hypothetical protein DC894_RS23310 [Vibrio parahaemolyticus]|nr:hypothetical protein [Vibrio parahaemolyticus]EGQ8703706.1 hypothetical protein [Vibrio parahaemolyticus]EGR3459629.1 hypothetical protein [Vibrio parahaemolyticus]EJC7187327.1 hypothetical protein [Vibrio parahaemolyticus]EJG0062277.1 hypothetical protein [Vibrio parahaemolyticus]